MAVGGQVYKDSSRVIWARAVIPRHAFIMWILMHQRISIKYRMARFTNKITNLSCERCNEAEEEINHLFFQCKWAKEY